MSKEEMCKFLELWGARLPASTGYVTQDSFAPVEVERLVLAG